MLDPSAAIQYDFNPSTGCKQSSFDANSKTKYECQRKYNAQAAALKHAGSKEHERQLESLSRAFLLHICRNCRPKAKYTEADIVYRRFFLLMLKVLGWTGSGVVAGSYVLMEFKFARV